MSARRPAAVKSPSVVFPSLAHLMICLATFANDVIFAIRALLADAIQRDGHVGQSAWVEFVINHDNSTSLPRGSESQRPVDVHRILGLLGLLQQRIALAARW